MGSSKGQDGKQPFQELIGTRKFVEIFKNTIRDYYTYGYKSYSQFVAGEKQLRTRWLVLSEALGEKWEFVKRRHGRNRIALRTMQCGDDHTIEELFFLHYMKEWGDYINCLFDLDPASRFRGSIEKLPVCEDDLFMIVTEKGKLPLMNVNELEYAIIENWICGLERQYKVTRLEHDGQNTPPGDGNTIVPVRVNRQLKIWSPWTRTYREDNPNDLYKNLCNRTSVMEAFGILGNLKNNPDARETWTSLEYKKYCSDSTRLNKLFKDGVPSKMNAAAEESGRDYWYKSVLTMENLIKKADGSFPDGEIQKVLLESLTVMCGFFSEYFPLGEVGVILEKRLLGGQATDPDQSNCFRFKHNYLQKPLYDYHLIDLWLAIENTYLCKMKYAHATTLRQMEDIGIPLEIRISVNNGREYVMYYQPWEQRIKAMRIEFIDEIEMYSREISAIKLYKKTTVKEGRRKVVKTDILSVLPSLKADGVTRQIIEAKKMLRFLWGTEINGCSVTDDWNSSLRSYKISVSYKADTENYIAARLKKESRQLSGIRDSGNNREPMPFIEIKCFPTKELRSWIRSYYQRVYIPERWEDSAAGEAFSMAEDIEELYSLYNHPEADVRDNKREEPEYDPEAEIYYGYIVEGAKKPRKTAQKIKGIRTSVKAPAHAGHEELFNEFFSKYAIAAANALLHCASDRRRFSLEDFKTILREEVQKLAPFYERLERKECRGEPERTDEINTIVERLTEYLIDSELIDEEGKTRFISSRKDYLYDFLPLTRIEVRWLLTALEDPLAKIFFSEELLDAGILEDLRKHLRGGILKEEGSPSAGMSGQCINANGAGTGMSGTPREKSELAEKASTEALAVFFQKAPFEAEALPMEKINYFDRYNIKDLRTGFQSTGYTQTRSEEEIRQLRTIYRAMRSGRKLRIRYKNWKDEERDVTCSPAWIEYSARDNIFRVWYCDSNRRKVMKINVPRILELEPVQNDGFDLRSEQEKAEEAVREKMKTICVEFYRGVRNLPDRILTEFSLWPKECEYDIHSGKFTMTLHYPVFDEKEILIRLMGYGPYIKIIRDDGGFILKELKKRIRIQRDLIRSIEFEKR